MLLSPIAKAVPQSRTAMAFISHLTERIILPASNIWTNSVQSIKYNVRINVLPGDYSKNYVQIQI